MLEHVANIEIELTPALRERIAAVSQTTHARTACAVVSAVIMIGLYLDGWGVLRGASASPTPLVVDIGGVVVVGMLQLVWIFLQLGPERRLAARWGLPTRGERPLGLFGIRRNKVVFALFWPGFAVALAIAVASPAGSSDDRIVGAITVALILLAAAATIGVLRAVRSAPILSWDEGSLQIDAWLYRRRVTWLIAPFVPWQLSATMALVSDTGPLDVVSTVCSGLGFVGFVYVATSWERRRAR